MEQLSSKIYPLLVIPEGDFFLCELNLFQKKEKKEDLVFSFIQEYLTTNDLYSTEIKKILLLFQKDPNHKKQKASSSLSCQDNIKRRKSGHQQYQSSLHSKIVCENCHLNETSDIEYYCDLDKEGYVCLNCGIRNNSLFIDIENYQWETNQTIIKIKRYERLTHFRANYRKLMRTKAHDKYQISPKLLKCFKKIIQHIQKKQNPKWVPSIKWIKGILRSLKMSARFHKISKMIELLGIPGNYLSLNREQINSLELNFTKFNEMFDDVCPNRKYFLNYPYCLNILLEKRLRIKIDWLPEPKMRHCLIWNEMISRKIFSKLGWDWWVTL